MSVLVDFPVRHTHDRDTVPKDTVSTGGVQPRSAVSLLRQARWGLGEAQREPVPAHRYALAYLAALRAAAAMLALRGRPHRSRARPTSAWVLLSKLAPELREWAAFFAAGSGTSAAVRAGVIRGVTQRAADDLVRQAALFADLVDGAVRRSARPSVGCPPPMSKHAYE